MSLLFSPVTFGKFSLNGRLVLPPMASAKADKNGTVTEDLCRYYDEKTRGGFIGLVITEHAYVSPEGRLTAGQLSAAEDGCIEGLKRLAAVIRKNGPAVIAQITHAGGAASSAITGLPVLGAGSIRPSGAVSHEDTPQTMNRDDIRKVISNFAAAARRIEKAGFDGVEIHSAHGYLLNQFYSPLLNDRTDEYTGQTLEGRLKLHLEILEAVRACTGHGFSVAVRLGARDYEDGGAAARDSAEACLRLEKAGTDLLDISGGVSGSRYPYSKEEGWFKEITADIKKKVSVPVILTGGIVSAQAAENLLQTGAADLIGVGRALLQNSLWAKEAKTVLG